MSQNIRSSLNESRSLASWRLLALVVLGACGDGATAPTGQPLRPELVAGTWTFQLTDTAGCAGPDFAHDMITARIALESDPPEVIQFIDLSRSTWRSHDVSGWISGWFSLRVPGAGLLNFGVGEPGSDTVRVFQVLGTLSGTYELAGSAADLADGSVPVLSPSPCTYRFLGIHD